MELVKIDLDKNEQRCKLIIIFDGEEFESIIAIQNFKCNKKDGSFSMNMSHTEQILKFIKVQK